MNAAPLATRRTRRVTRLGHLRACLPACAATAAAGLAVGAAAAELRTGVGVVAGVAVAAASLGLGAFVVDLGDRRAREQLLLIGLGVYLLTVVGLGVLLLPYAGTGGPLVAGLPWGVVLGVGTWVPVQCWWAWTSPTPYVELPGADAVTGVRRRR